MSAISFPYKSKPSSVFKTIKRPVAEVFVLSPQRQRWLKYTLIVDTGADYTVFPISASKDLKINVEKGCQQFFTRGIGGSEKVYIYKKGLQIKIGDNKVKIPVGFLERDDIPPLLGRHKCLDNFELTFCNFITSFKK